MYREDGIYKMKKTLLSNFSLLVTVQFWKQKNTFIKKVIKKWFKLNNELINNEEETSRLIVKSDNGTRNGKLN